MYRHTNIHKLYFSLRQQYTGNVQYVGKFGLHSILYLFLANKQQSPIKSIFEQSQIANAEQYR